jgi:glyoxylate reductase
MLGQDVHHKTLGIVGLGRIGYAVAKRAKGFDMNVLYNDIEEKPYAKDVNAKLVSFETLLKVSPVLNTITLTHSNFVSILFYNTFIHFIHTL